MLTGTKAFLDGLSDPLLETYCHTLHLNIIGPKSELIERIMENVFGLEPLNKEVRITPKSANKERKRRGSWVNPPLNSIEEGKFDATGLFDNFNLPPLVEFCKSHGIDPKGKKTKVIRRILQYLEAKKNSTVHSKGVKRPRESIEPDVPFKEEEFKEKIERIDMDKDVEDKDEMKIDETSSSKTKVKHNHSTTTTTTTTTTTNYTENEEPQSKRRKNL